MKHTVFALAAASALLGCGGGDRAPETAGSTASATAAPMSDVDHALAVQRGVDAAPGKADSVLTAHGLTGAGFDSLMYRIAADSAKRAAFAAGR